MPDTPALHAALARADLPKIRCHDLRHSAATLQLAAGVPLAVISRTLGHSSLAITADIYAAVTPELRRYRVERREPLTHSRSR